MGMYDYVVKGETILQIKFAENTGNVYKLGDVIDAPDGLFITYEGAVLIDEGHIKEILNEKEIFNKWGGNIDLNFLGKYNVIAQISNSFEAKKHFGLI